MISHQPNPDRTKQPNSANSVDLFDLLKTLPDSLQLTLQLDPETGISHDFVNKLSGGLNSLSLAAIQIGKGQPGKAAASMAKFGKAISNQMTYSEYLERELLAKCHGQGFSVLSHAHFTASTHWPNLAAAVNALDDIARQIRSCFNQHLDGRTEIDTQAYERLMHQAFATVYPTTTHHKKALEKLAPAALNPICQALGWTVVGEAQASPPSKDA